MGWTEPEKAHKSFFLRDYISSFGRDSYLYWSRGGYTAGFEFIKSLLRCVFSKKLPQTGRSKKRTKILHKPTISRIWLNLAILDLIILYTFIRIKSSIGCFVICDRFVEDTRIDFLLNFPHIKFENFFIWRFFTVY